MKIATRCRGDIFLQATSSIPVSGSTLVWMNIFEANTASPVTVSFNGGSTLTIKTNSGNDIAAGGLVAGMTVAGIVSGSTFRLLSDQVSAAVVAAAEAAQAAAEAAAVSVNIKNVATRTALKALNTAVTTLVFLGESGRDGLFSWKSGDYSVEIAADTQEGLYIKADAIPVTSGAWVRQSGWSVRGVIPEWFGAVGDGVADDTVALEAVVNIGMHAEFGRKSYITTRKLVPKNGVHWNGHGGVPILEFGTPSGYFPDSATKILLKGTGLKEHTIAGATSRSVANPDVGAPYLA
ncbi:hypothetical protein [Rhizobium sp. 007]|uniref:hypothetical protein n=1 Tax=Rhizobium sp. 007 TaxID=2785056 RepID=UPI00188ED68A|nr:hypothetical protein [Rhizobium sp. 007]QPB18742.1 hypothetical protein ISN39_13905 [Rhizobium sp. 007]